MIRVQLSKLLTYTVFLCITLIGCTTVQGPAVNRIEINEETKRLEAKSLEYSIEQIKKVNQIGYYLMSKIDKEDVKVGSRFFMGLFVLPRNKATNRFFKMKPNEGVYVAFVLKDTPIAKANIKEGDLIVAINDEKIENVKNVAEFIDKKMKKKKMKVGDQVVFKVVRNNNQ